jgi:DNA-binding NarL/FixJ family response regulator
MEDNMTMLIVDDNNGIRRLLRRTFLQEAETIWECSNGSDALVLYALHHPDVVLMDIRMLGMDGLTATRQIRLINPSARVVVVTDYDDEDLRVAASEAGACGYALKQNMTDLPKMIHSLLSPN